MMEHVASVPLDTSPGKTLLKKPRPRDSRTRAIKDSLKSMKKTAVGDLKWDALDEALLNLTGDIVVLGGYRGSVLYERNTDRQLWPSIRAGLNLAKVDLELGISIEDDQHNENNIYSPGTFSHLGPIDISRRLIRWLRESHHAKDGSLRVWDYGWDWRLHPKLCSLKLQEFLEGLRCNQKNNGGGRTGATIIAHSLGGLIVRHAINLQPELFAGVVYVGTPQAVPTILGPLRNGDAVLFSQRIFSAQVNFTFRTSFLLLPLHGRCFRDKNTQEEIILDYFDYNTWIDHRLSPCIDPPVLVAQEKLIASRQKHSFTIDVLERSKRRRSNFPRRKYSALADVAEPIENNRPSRFRRARTVFAKQHKDIEDMLSLEANMQPSMNNSAGNDAIKTPITITREHAINYLSRVLPEIKRFKEELEFNPIWAANNRYPPMAVVYSDSFPTISGVLVETPVAIKNEDTYENVIFERGDGVVLTREAMLPSGYVHATGGLVESDRSHTGLLGDFEAIGQALVAITRTRRKTPVVR